MAYNLIIVGCSLGGLKALQILLSGLSTLVTPVISVQHRDKDSNTSGLLGYMLQKASHRRVQEADDKTPIAQGEIYIAPADYHLMVENDRIVLSMESPVAHARPSIDVALETAARCYGSSAAGVILTGAGCDGAQGLAQLEQRGGLPIVQDPVTAEQPSMPRAAIAACRAPTILPMQSIAPFLCALETTGDLDHGTRAAR
jgi:two-component system, chemotaxis family, protein-glutamate methylesterase/glutaminase